MADSYQELHDAYRQREEVFAATMADRADWDGATVQQRQLSVAADAELRRRHRDQHYPPLRSAEPELAARVQNEELTITAREQTLEDQSIKDLGAAHRTFADRLADRQSLTIPSEDLDYGDLGQAFPPGPDQARTRSCGRLSRRSGRPHGSSSATSTGRPPIDRRGMCHRAA
jgi:hypothetical protein